MGLKVKVRGKNVVKHQVVTFWRFLLLPVCIQGFELRGAVALVFQLLPPLPM